MDLLKVGFLVTATSARKACCLCSLLQCSCVPCTCFQHPSNVLHWPTAAIGLCNFFAAAFSTIPTAGSISRAAIVNSANGKTRELKGGTTISSGGNTLQPTRGRVCPLHCCVWHAGAPSRSSQCHPALLPLLLQRCPTL